MSIVLNGTTGITTPDITSTTSTLGSLTQALNLGSTGQIVFPATQNASTNANTLDDYEEGTWTPTCPVTLTTANGAYIKVGSVVFFSIRLSVSANASSTGFTVSLPFAASSDDTTRAGGWFSYTNGGSANTSNTTLMLQGGGVGTLVAYNVNGAGRPSSEFNAAYWIGGQYRTA